MRQSATGFFTCPQCDAAYDSDAALQDHKNTAHRGRGSNQPSSEFSAAPGASSETHPASSAATPILRATKRIFPDWNEFLRACNIVTEISRSTS
jgi:hypothetical protein